MSEQQSAEQKVAIMLKALEFYAAFGHGEMSDKLKINRDRGREARKALVNCGFQVTYPRAV